MRKVANFLKKDLTDEVIQSIADKCSFQNLKTANETMKQRPLNLVERLTEEEKGRMIKHKPPQMYRKGKVLLNCCLMLSYNVSVFFLFFFFFLGGGRGLGGFHFSN